MVKTEEIKEEKLKEKIEFICYKRLQSLKYLLDIHNNSEFWLNVTKLSKEDFLNSFNEEITQKKYLN